MSQFFCLLVPKISAAETFGASEMFGYWKKFCKKGRTVGCHEFALKNFCLTAPKNFLGETFGVLEIFRHQKILCIRGGGGITILCRHIFVSQCRKNSWGGPSVLKKNSSIRKPNALKQEGGFTILCRKFFVSRYRKTS